jgi:lysylphosphatidylglycerol synthetase-like protein (DUF2156 family)
MTDEDKNEAGRGPETGTATGQPARLGNMRTLQFLPGLAAVSLYMLLLAGINVLGVVTGQIRPAYLVFSAVFIAAGLGLLLLLRWAWALTLAAMVLLVALSLWKFAFSHQPPYIFQGLLNLVFFLYLVRTEVREKLR